MGTRHYYKLQIIGNACTLNSHYNKLTEKDLNVLWVEQ